MTISAPCSVLLPLGVPFGRQRAGGADLVHSHTTAGHCARTRIRRVVNDRDHRAIATSSPDVRASQSAWARRRFACPGGLWTLRSLVVGRPRSGLRRVVSLGATGTERGLCPGTQSGVFRFVRERRLTWLVTPRHHAVAGHGDDRPAIGAAATAVPEFAARPHDRCGCQ